MLSHWKFKFQSAFTWRYAKLGSLGDTPMSSIARLPALTLSHIATTWPRLLSHLKLYHDRLRLTFKRNYRNFHLSQRGNLKKKRHWESYKEKWGDTKRTFGDVSRLGVVGRDDRTKFRTWGSSDKGKTLETMSQSRWNLSKACFVWRRFMCSVRKAGE